MMKNKAIRVLHIEDDSEFIRLVQKMVSDANAENLSMESAESLAAGLQSIRKGNVNVVPLDLGLPNSKGVVTLEKLRTEAPDLPVSVPSAQGEETTVSRTTGFSKSAKSVSGKRKGLAGFSTSIIGLPPDHRTCLLTGGRHARFSTCSLPWQGERALETEWFPWHRGAAEFY